MRNKLKYLLITFVIIWATLKFSVRNLSASDGSRTPIPGGRFPTELLNATVSPDCLTVRAGGRTGPGSGITIYNNCGKEFDVQSISETGKRPPKDGYLAYLFLKPGSMDWNIISTLKIGSHFKRCTKFLPATQIKERQCRNVRFPHGSELLVFVWDDFLITGSEGLRVQGTVKLKDK